MILSSWRRRRAGRRANKNKTDTDNDNLYLDTEVEVAIPTHFRCPISLDLMKDPVTLSTGITYDRSSIETWIESGNQTCPVTNQTLHSLDQIPNHAIRKMIQEWCVQNRSRGVERIPTPRVPVSPYEVADTCKKINNASGRGDYKRCRDLVAKVRAWGRDSDRNKRCVVENGTGCVLASLFESLASDFSDEERVALLQDVVSVLSWTFPLGHDGQCSLGSKTSLNCMTWLLRNGDLSARQNAAYVLKELLASDECHVEALSRTDDVAETLFNMVKAPICAAATNSSLVIIYLMISTIRNTSTNIIVSKFINLGLVSVLIELLVDGDKGTCERALGVLERLCDEEQGREEAYGHAMAVPILVKKILRVSEMGTEMALSVLWKVSRGEERRREEVAVEAVRVGGFQKVLVLFQVGCGEGTREKATNLLKLLNHYKHKAECVESSMDFKYLKRSC